MYRKSVDSVNNFVKFPKILNFKIISRYNPQTFLRLQLLLLTQFKKKLLCSFGRFTIKPFLKLQLFLDFCHLLISHLVKALKLQDHMIIQFCQILQKC